MWGTSSYAREVPTLPAPEVIVLANPPPPDVTSVARLVPTDPAPDVTTVATEVATEPTAEVTSDTTLPRS